MFDTFAVAFLALWFAAGVLYAAYLYRIGGVTRFRP